VEAQLAAVYPGFDEDARRTMADAVYEHLARTVVEVFREDPSALLARARVEPGWDALDRALAGGRGAIAATAHLGNFELGGRMLAARYPLLDVVKPQRNRLFEAELQRLRNSHGIATVPMDRSGRAVLRHLADGGLVSLFVDQDAGGAGLPLDFLGLPASTWPGAARVALRTGCPVVPMAIVRAGGEHVLHLGEPIAVAAAPPSPARVGALMARISAAVEVFVRDHPEQWFWVHRRWKGAASARQAVGDKETPCEA
jgi:KDO2-lipid IV(A) lauroyltransferase